MKRKQKILIGMTIIIFIGLWFSDVLPKQVVKMVAGNYISQQEKGKNYELDSVEYSPAYDCYFAYYKDKRNPNVNTRYWSVLSVVTI